MPDDQIEIFANHGLGLGEENAKKFADVFGKFCVLLAIPAGLGLSLMAVSDVRKAGGGQPVPKSFALVMVLAGLGIGTLVAGSACATMKTKIQTFVASYPDAKTAIAALTPGKRTELRNEAFKLLRLSDKIDELHKQHDEDEGSLKFARSA